MKKKFSLTMIIFIIVIFNVILILITSYNSLVDAEVGVDNAQSQVINRLNQRQESINQLQATVTGLQEHDETIYNMITEAREAYATASSADDVLGMIEADALQSQAINQLLVVMEDNPDIEASSAFLILMDNISALESSLSQARKDYNDSVAGYNSDVRKFPKVLFAAAFGFEKEKPYWKMNGGADEIPVIDFGNE
jgi:LemA protein